MKATHLTCTILLVSLTFGFSSCESNDHPVSYEAPVTSMVVTLTPDSGQVVILSFIDNDGLGGMPPLVNSCELRKNTAYACKVMVGSAAAPTSAKLEHFIDSTSAEATPELHQVFYSPSSNLFIEAEYADVDLNGFPIGFASVLVTGRASSGSLSMKIIHHPNKSAPEVAKGNALHAGGSTDVEAVFQVTIKED